jgi:hypothetical protein
VLTHETFFQGNIYAVHRVLCSSAHIKSGSSIFRSKGINPTIHSLVEMNSSRDPQVQQSIESKKSPYMFPKSGLLKSCFQMVTKTEGIFSHTYPGSDLLKGGPSGGVGTIGARHGHAR